MSRCLFVIVAIALVACGAPSQTTQASQALPPELGSLGSVDFGVSVAATTVWRSVLRLRRPLSTAQRLLGRQQRFPDDPLLSSSPRRRMRPSGSPRATSANRSLCL